MQTKTDTNGLVYSKVLLDLISENEILAEELEKEITPSVSELEKEFKQSDKIKFYEKSR